MVDSALPLLRDASWRCFFAFFRLFRRLLFPPFSFASLPWWHDRAPGPGIRGRADVALRHDRVRNPGGGHHQQRSGATARACPCLTTLLARRAAHGASETGARSMSMRPLTRVGDYWTLTKPDVNLLIGITTAAGFWLGRSSQAHELSDVPYVQLFHTVVGTLLVASGTGTLNQWVERRFDALMRRTARRPVAAGRITPSHALVFGLVLSIA